MNIHWDISENDIHRLRDFINQHHNPFVESRIARNVHRQGITIDNNSILKAIAMCLLTTQQRSGPNTPIAIFLKKDPFPLTGENISQNVNIEDFVRLTLQQNGLNRYINRIPSFFTFNYTYLKDTKWQIFHDLDQRLSKEATKEVERNIADRIADTLNGFGPKQSRNLLQALGLTKYEIPIDSRITTWLNNFGFPIPLSSIALQDKGYYHFVSDGIQKLCELGNIYPCVLDAAIFSSYDNEQWNDENIVY